MAEQEDVRRIALSLPGASEKGTEPHYNGCPAVHVRLAAIETDLLEELVVGGWRCQSPRSRVETGQPEGARG